MKDALVYLMMGAIALALLMFFGPIFAGILLVLAMMVVLVIFLPVVIIMVPWIIVGGIIWLIFF